MHSVVINGKKYVAEDNAPLKESLTKAGYRFPCGGNGKCGKCRINCPLLPVSALDKRFLTENQLSSGIRLACDKKVVSGLEIDCEVVSDAPNIILKECNVAVSITDSEISVGIVGESLVETVVKRNPLALYDTFNELERAYKSAPLSLTNSLRAVIGKECVELFEKYGAAKAAVAAISGKSSYLNILAGLDFFAAENEAVSRSETDSFGLPAESLYILPSAGEYIGGEVLAECILLKERSLLIDCEKTVSFLHVGDKDNVATAIWDCDYSEFALRCIRAAVKFLIKDSPVPVVVLYGPHAYEVEDFLADDELTCIHREKSLLNVTDALLSFRVRSRLLKEKNRTTFLKIYGNEDFQNFLTDNC